jgi:tetratricopeptide (TPR) repeat protein
MGKTRLLREVLHKIELLGAGRAPAQVVLGRAEATRKTVSLGLVTSALHSAFGMLEGEDQPAWRHRVRVRVKRSVAKEELDRVAVFLGELVGAPFPDQAHPLLAAARADSIRMGDQIRRAWEDWLEAEARRAPIVLAFEDVQWADPPSVRFIEAAARNLAHLPVLIIALARPEVDGLFPGLLGAANATRIELGPLSPESCSALVRAALGNAIEEAAVQRIVQHSDGNAFHLEELIRAVSEGRSAKLPETVMAMVEARLDALDPEARRALRAAAVIGPTFTAGAMATLLGNPDAAALRGWIAELARRELVVSRGFSTATGEPELAFRSALVREAAYAMLTEEDRALGHRLAAAWVQKNGRPRDAIVVAEHLERGGEPASASSWFARAAELALESNDFAEAVSCAQRGRATTTDEAARGTLLVVQAEAHRHLGDNPGMLARSIEAMATLRRGDRAWWSAAADAVLGAIRMGKKDDLDRLCSEMRGFSGQLPAAAARIGHYLHFAGRHDVATELLHQVAAIDDPTDPGRWAWMHRAHATRGLVTGDVGSYLEHLQHAVKAFDLAGDVRDPASERVNVGFAQAELGLYDDAEVTLRAALGTAERLGLLHVVAAAQQNLASVLSRLGRMEESKTILLLAIATFAAQGNKRMEGNSRVYLARILLLERDLVEAQKEALHGAQLLSAVRPLLPMAVATSALVFLMSGRKEEARLLASDALDALVAVGHLDEGESFVRLTHAEALAAVGDRDAANESIGIARSRLLERAAAIRNLVWKESFLENVFENARTLALAHAWLGN